MQDNFAAGVQCTAVTGGGDGDATAIPDAVRGTRPASGLSRKHPARCLGTARIQLVIMTRDPGVSTCGFRHRFRPITPRALGTLPVQIIPGMYPFSGPGEAR
jgi:hypothetical protein